MFSDALTNTSKSARNCIFSPRGDSFVYLQNEIGGPHMQCCSLWKVAGILHTHTMRPGVTVVMLLKFISSTIYPAMLLSLEGSRNLTHTQ